MEECSVLRGLALSVDEKDLVVSGQMSRRLQHAQAGKPRFQGRTEDRPGWYMISSSNGRTQQSVFARWMYKCFIPQLDKLQ